MERFPIFADLDEAEVREILQRARRRRFRRGEVICHEGDPGDTAHLIDKGHVAVRITTPLGDVATVRVLGPGELFGEMAALDERPRMATIVALRPTETWSLHRRVIDELRREQRSVDRTLLHNALDEVRRLSVLLMESYYVPVPARVARALDRLADSFGSTVTLTQDDLAGLCGTTRQTVNEVLNGLAARHVVVLGRGRVEIVDRDQLRRLAR